MAQESGTQSIEYESFWRRWRKRILIVFFLAAVLGAAGFWYFSSRIPDTEAPVEDTTPEVRVRAYGDLVAGATIEKVATLESAHSAPLVARAGGRVTGLQARLGDTVAAGQLVVAFDGGHEANPAAAGLAVASSSLAAFDDIQATALASADLGIATAQLSVGAAEAGRALTGQQLAKSREQSDLAVRQAELTLEDVQNNDDQTDALLRSADLALQAAELAQDQATIARNLGSRQTGDALKQARQGLATAEAARVRLVADLASQRVAIAGQVATAREQVQLLQVTAPLAGQITRLSVTEGDFIRPGQEIGEINAFAGARVTLDVPTAVRNHLQAGDLLMLHAGGQEFSGEIVRLANAPRSDVAQWQIDIFISSTPAVLHSGELVVVELPIGPVATSASSVFIPLDVVTVRQDGIVLLTVEDDVVVEHVVVVDDFSGDFVAGTTNVADDALVVVSGNRTLQAGDTVRVISES